MRGYAFLDHISYLLFAFHASEVSQGDMQRSPASFLWDSHGKLCRQADIALQVHYLSGPVAVADGGGEPAHPGDILVVRRRLQGNKTYAWRTRARCSAFCCTAGLSPDVVSTCFRQECKCSDRCAALLLSRGHARPHSVKHLAASARAWLQHAAHRTSNQRSWALRLHSPQVEICNLGPLPGDEVRAGPDMRQRSDS